MYLLQSICKHLLRFLLFVFPSVLQSELQYSAVSICECLLALRSVLLRSVLSRSPNVLHVPPSRVVPAQELYEETGIDLENLVYYRDETHYFVMTAKKPSLLAKRVLKRVRSPSDPTRCDILLLHMYMYSTESRRA